MSKKQLRKIHIDDTEYIYVVRKGYPDDTWVNVWLGGDKSNPLYQFEFGEYEKITPSKVKEKIQEQLNINQ